MQSPDKACLAALQFHHLGLAVATPDEAFRMLAVLGYRIGAEVFDPHQRVNVALWNHMSMPDVEVIWPGAEPSPIDRLVRRYGPLVYHLCFACADPDGAIAALEAEGLETVLVSPSAPAPLFGGCEVSFHAVSGFGLIELLCLDPMRSLEHAA